MKPNISNYRPMYEEINLQAHRLKCRIKELNNRLSLPTQWTAGEKEIYRVQLKAAIHKLNHLNQELNKY